MNILKIIKDKFTRKDTLKSLTSVEKKQDKETSSTELIKRQQIADTPFTIIELEDKSYILACGRYKIMESKIKQDLLQKVQRKDWILISSLITTIVDYELLTRTNNK